MTKEMDFFSGSVSSDQMLAFIWTMTMQNWVNRQKQQHDEQIYICLFHYILDNTFQFCTWFTVHMLHTNYTAMFWEQYNSTITSTQKNVLIKFEKSDPSNFERVILHNCWSQSLKQTLMEIGQIGVTIYVTSEHNKIDLCIIISRLCCTELVREFKYFDANDQLFL